MIGDLFCYFNTGNHNNRFKYPTLYLLPTEDRMRQINEVDIEMNSRTDWPCDTLLEVVINHYASNFYEFEEGYWKLKKRSSI